MIEMNKGIIAGVVRTAEGNPVARALIGFKGLLTGATNMKNGSLTMHDIWNPTASEGATPGRIHIAYADKHGRYLVPFLWDKTEIGDWGVRKKFLIRAYTDWKTTPAKSGGGTGYLYIALDVQKLIQDMLPTPGLTTAASLKDFKLPAAFKRILMPRTSMPDMVGLGYCDIWLDGSQWG
jgi:hypothetical protein